MTDAIEIEPGVWSIIHNTRVYEVRVAGDQVLINGHPIEVATPQAARRIAVTGPVQIRATMPGKVVRVLVEVGDTVVTGQGVIIVEAMKMQNELKSPRDGRVTHIAAQPHATVDAGVLLVTIE